MKKSKYLLRKYRHGLLFSYFLLYFPWFFYLEKTITTSCHPIHMALDDHIPFIEYFIIPYDLWFLYLGGALIFFFLKSKPDFLNLCLFLFAGMTLFLVISTVYPNGHDLRPDHFVRENLCIGLVRLLYATDTPTNLFPSIHVYNSIGIHLAVSHSPVFVSRPVIRKTSFVLAVSIILSTVFLKQHSMFDVITAFLFAAIMYPLVYGSFSLSYRSIEMQK